MQPMLIRPPAPDEITAMARVELAARADAERRWSPPPSGLHAFDPEALSARWAAAGWSRVALVDRRLVGCIARGVDPDGLYVAHGPFVDPLHLRTGIGRALLAVAMRRARIAGAERMALWIPAADPRARAFTRAMGFVDDGGRRPLAGSAAGLVRRVAVLPAGLAHGN